MVLSLQVTVLLDASLQIAVEKPLLCLACRHHIPEVVLAHVVKALTLDDTSLEQKIFNLLQKKLHLLEHFNEVLLDISVANLLPAKN